MALRIGKIIVGLGLVGLAGWQAARLHANLLNQRRPLSVPTAMVKRDEFIVGVTESGVLTSRNVTSVTLGETDGTVTWVAKDGIRVSAGEVFLRLDAKQVSEDIDKQELELKQIQGRVSQDKRNKTQDAENADREVTRANEGLEVLKKSNRTEHGKAQAQLDYDKWQRQRASIEHERQARLADHGLAPRHEAELAHRKLRAAEFGVGKSERDLDLVDTRHGFSVRQHQDDIDSAAFQAEMAHGRIQTAGRSAREQARMKSREVERTRIRLSRAIVRAPVDGLLMLGRAWSSDEGRHTIKAGDRLWWNHKVADICNLENMEITLHIDELRATGVRVGQTAITRFEAVPGREFKGEVIRKSPVARRIDRWDDPTAPRDLRVFDVIIAMRTFDAKVLRPGMNAEVQIVFSRIPKTLVIPVEALQRRRGQEVVYVSQDGGFVARELAVGRRGPHVVEVLEGVREGERVAIVPVPPSALRRE